MASRSPFSRIVFAMPTCIALWASVVALGACSHAKAPPQAAPPTPGPTPTCPKAGYAGTTNVPQRRAIRGEEMTPEVAQRSREILDGNRDTAFGTEVPFEVNGQSYIGRIEEHCHEPGGSRRPWGRHRGVTVYHAE
jgi:hypothetical protein